jgi:hypothetical protein
LQQNDTKKLTVMNKLKKMIEVLGVTMDQLRSGCRKRHLTDARAMLAAALPATQCQVAELLGCSQPAVGKMRKRHEELLTGDAGYRAKWERVKLIVES